MWALEEDMIQCLKVYLTLTAARTHFVYIHLKPHVSTCRYSHKELILELYKFIVYSCLIGKGNKYFTPIYVGLIKGFTPVFEWSETIWVVTNGDKLPKILSL